MEHLLCVDRDGDGLGFNTVGLTHESLEYSLGVDYAIYSHDLHPSSTCLSHMETQATACPQCCLAPGLFLQPPTPSTAGSRIVHGNLDSSSESQAQKFIVNSLPQGDYTLSEISTLTPGSSEDPKSIRNQRRGMFRESVRQKQEASCAFPLA